MIIVQAHTHTHTNTQKHTHTHTHTSYIEIMHTMSITIIVELCFDNKFVAFILSFLIHA